MLRRQRHLPIARHPQAAPADTRPVARGGFTLVEMMVAVVILAVGLLGLASTAGYVVRQVGGGAQQSIAASVAQSRTEYLRSLPCDSIKSGSATTRGVRERWARGTTANKVLTVYDTLQYRFANSQAGPDKSGTTTRTYTIMVPCW